LESENTGVNGATVTAEEDIADIVANEPARKLVTELDRERDANVKDLVQDTELKKRVAHFTMWATAVQLLVADALFLVYCVSQWRNIPVGAIDVWLGAAVIQVVGLMAIVSHYLFPNRDRKV
jgi:F420-0:gamma-glutamyl ligase-like protein